MKEQLEMRVPCWLIADAEDAALDQAPRVMTMQANGKTILQLFLEENEAKRFIKEGGLKDSRPFIVPTIEHLAGIVEHLQKLGINEVHVFSKTESGFNRANIAIIEFMMGLRLHLNPDGSKQ